MTEHTVSFAGSRYIMNARDGRDAVRKVVLARFTDGGDAQMEPVEYEFGDDGSAFLDLGRSSQA